MTVTGKSFSPEKYKKLESDRRFKITPPEKELKIKVHKIEKSLNISKEVHTITGKKNTSL